MDKRELQLVIQPQFCFSPPDGRDRKQYLKPEKNWAALDSIPKSEPALMIQGMCLQASWPDPSLCPQASLLGLVCVHFSISVQALLTYWRYAYPLRVWEPNDGGIGVNNLKNKIVRLV